MNYKNTKGKEQALNKNSFRASLRSGFTLTEVLTVVIIIGILVSIALPSYVRSVERARATEAMNAIKALNDSIYVYYVDKEACPEGFSRLAAVLPEEKNFSFAMTAPVNVAGTPCSGVMATRIHGGEGGYAYKLWNPYTRGTTGKALTLQCAPVQSNDEKSIELCESLGFYREPEEGEPEE